MEIALFQIHQTSRRLVVARPRSVPRSRLRSGESFEKKTSARSSIGKGRGHKDDGQRMKKKK